MMSGAYARDDGTFVRRESGNVQTVVVGAGAMGSLLAARMAAAGAPVTLLGRPSSHLDAIRTTDPTSFGTGIHLRLDDPQPAEQRAPIPYQVRLGPNNTAYAFGRTGWLAPLILPA